MAITDEIHETLEPKDFDEEIQGHGAADLRANVLIAAAKVKTSIVFLH